MYFIIEISNQGKKKILLYSYSEDNPLEKILFLQMQITTFNSAMCEEHRNYYKFFFSGFANKEILQY